MPENDLKQLNYHKNKCSDVIFWVDNTEVKGERLFTFDKRTIFNLFSDYPMKLSNKEREIFAKENPYWADFFKDRL